MVLAWLLLLMKFVEGRTVAVRPFRVLGTLPGGDVAIAGQAACATADESTRARMLAVVISVRRPILSVLSWPLLIRR